MVKQISFLAFCCFACSLNAFAQHLPFQGNQTPTWDQCIAAFGEMDQQSTYASLQEVGVSDIGKPIHLFIINKDEIFYPELFNRKKNVLFINNNIHPGEPDGVDASIVLCKELLNPNNALHSLLDSTIICLIPMYNVDGAMIRSSTSRANQNGPEMYGFRGNGRNLDLNRDFIKCDSRNALSFNRIFTSIMPDVMVDTHVSNGADYTYTMTLISTQYDKLGGAAGKYLRETLEPALYRRMEKAGEPMSPYVNTMGATPETGISVFLESPRFATGYAALYNTIGFTTETHMLKPYAERVESTYFFLVELLKEMQSNGNAIRMARAESIKAMMSQRTVHLQYELDTTKKSTFKFEGYQAKEIPSEISAGQRLYYDHNSPWSRDVVYYKSCKASKSVDMPSYYIVPQAWREVIERLQANHIQMTQVPNDTLMKLQAWFIDDYKTGTRPYEGHYTHHSTSAHLATTEVQIFKGDWIISTNQAGKRYLATALEPLCDDGFFAWNFFDAVLQQKEWFSDYVFEDIAAELLKNDKALRDAFEKALKEDPSLQSDHWNALYWIYKHSDYYEPSVNRIPVYRIP